MSESANPTMPHYGMRPSLAWYLLGVLLVANILSYVDRQILVLLVQPIRGDLGISDTQISLLQGFAFTILYSVLGLPLGRYADRHNRKYLVACGIAIWSVMTMACGLASSYGELFVARIGVGIGEATLAPAAYSMICDAFHARRRGTALGAFTSGIYLGIGASIAIGGLVLAALRGAPEVTLPLFGTLRAWQAAFVCVGAPGLLVALLMLTVPEPARGAVNGVHEGASLRDALAYLHRHRSLFALQMLGYALLAMAAYGTGSWVPTMFIRSHHWAASQAGISYGLAVTVFGAIGGILAGTLGDRWLAAGRRDARLLLTAGVVVLWIPLICGGMLTGNPWVALACLGIGAGLSSMANGLGPTTLHDVVPGWLRGQATALFFFVINMVGLGVGPTAIALVTDRVFHDDAALHYSVIVVAVPAILLGIALLLCARKAYAERLTQLSNGEADMAGSVESPGTAAAGDAALAGKA